MAVAGLVTLPYAVVHPQGERGGVGWAGLAEGDREAAWPGAPGAGLLGSPWTTVRERSDLPGAGGPVGDPPEADRNYTRTAGPREHAVSATTDVAAAQRIAECLSRTSRCVSRFQRRAAAP
jgi:hypothetical protein